MDLGAFSVSLSVNNLEASRAFYTELGFEAVGGNAAEHWLILRNGEHVIGLFEGMFERNTLTFNPGWNQQGGESEVFTDVRELQRSLKQKGVSIVSEADDQTEGPANIMLIDPDGNPVLIDQHR